MNLIAFNAEITHRLRFRPLVALGVLPYGLMFASFVPLFFLAQGLAASFGLEDGPVKDHPAGLWFIVLFLGAMVIFMLGGYGLGWVLNALVLRFRYRWPPERLRGLLLESDVPGEWLKAGHERVDAAVSESTWAGMRQQGRRRFILRRGGSWGFFMFLVMGIPPVVVGNVEEPGRHFLTQALLWTVAGLLFGAVTWYFSERSYQKQRAREDGQGGAAEG